MVTSSGPVVFVVGVSARWRCVGPALRGPGPARYHVVADDGRRAVAVFDRVPGDTDGPRVLDWADPPAVTVLEIPDDLRAAAGALDQGSRLELAVRGGRLLDQGPSPLGVVLDEQGPRLVRGFGDDATIEALLRFVLPASEHNDVDSVLRRRLVAERAAAVGWAWRAAASARMGAYEAAMLRIQAAWVGGFAGEHAVYVPDGAPILGTEGMVTPCRGPSGAVVAVKWARDGFEAALDDASARWVALAGPGVAAPLDRGRRDGRPFVVLPWWPVSLTAWAGSASPSERARLAERLAARLGRLHDAGHLHGDLKEDHVRVVAGEPWFIDLTDAARTGATRASEELALSRMLASLMGGPVPVASARAASRAVWWRRRLPALIVAGAAAASAVALRPARSDEPVPVPVPYPVVAIGGGVLQQGGRTSDDLQETLPVDLVVHGFLLGEHEVDQALWRRLRRIDPALPDLDPRLRNGCGRVVRWPRFLPVDLTGGELPAVCLSWCDATRAANALSALDGIAPFYDPRAVDACSGAPVESNRGGERGWRLPSRAEHLWAVAVLGPGEANFAGAELVEAGVTLAGRGLADWVLAVDAGKDMWPTLAPADGRHLTGNAKEWLQDPWGRSTVDGAVKQTRDWNRMTTGGSYLSTADWADPLNIAAAPALAAPVEVGVRFVRTP